MWFIAMVLGYGVRNNMSMAIVVMTDKTLENVSDNNLKSVLNCASSLEYIPAVP